MAPLELRLLGTYRITLDGLPVVAALESDKVRALLAYLVVECDVPHPREKLLGLLWPEQDEAHARGSLSQALYVLRRVLGDRPQTGRLPPDSLPLPREPFLLISPHEVQFNPRSNYRSDLSDFLALMAAIKAHPHPHPARGVCEDCLRRYQEAVGLYRGDFLDGFFLPRSMAFEEWAMVLREQYRLQVVAALEYLARAFERRGELDQALVYARKIVQLEELVDAGHEVIIRLLGLLGRRAEALAHYQTYQNVLTTQLGAEPGAGPMALYQQLKREEEGSDPVNLPAVPTSIIGRKQALDELWGWLDDPKARLITVLGPGGCGKTRLALEAARRQRYTYRDGVFFIPLSAQGPGSSLLAVIAQGLGFSLGPTGDPKKQLLDYLGRKQVLLVLDSFELVADRAGLVAEILAASEASKALVTSRVRLNLSAEQVYPLGGMGVPPAGAEQEILSYEAVNLFLEAAWRVKPGYIPDSLEGIARICQLLQGMPLGLMLASTWVGEYSAQEIIAQISQNLDFLAADWADLPARQRSLRATYEYSWNLLSSHEQQILMNLAVFRGPFTGPVAWEVTGASPGDLHSLVGKSLLWSIEGGRYLMHDLVHQYSLEKLARAPGGHEATIRQKHSSYYLSRVPGWVQPFKGVQQQAQLTEADKEIHETQAAWEWAARQAEVESLAKALEGLSLYYSLRYRHSEGVLACQAAVTGLAGLPQTSERLNLEGTLLVWQACFCRAQGNPDRAWNLLAQARLYLDQAAAAGQDARLGQALLWKEYGYLSASLAEQLDCLLRSASLFESLGDPWQQAKVVAWAGEIAQRKGDHDLSLELLRKGEQLARAAGEPHRLADILRDFGYYSLIFGSPEAGMAMMRESARGFQAAGDLVSQGEAEMRLGTALLWIGRIREGCDFLELSLDKLRQVGDSFQCAFGTLALGLGYLADARYQQAGLTLEEGLGLAHRGGFRREEAFALAGLGTLALAQGAPAQAKTLLEESVSRFRQMGFAGELSMALGSLALVRHRLHEDDQAWADLREALGLAVETRSRFSILNAMSPALVEMLAEAGRGEQALEAYTALKTDPLLANAPLFADLTSSCIESVRQQLAEDVRRAAEARGREGDLFRVLGRLLAEIKSWEVGAEHAPPS